VRNKYQRKEHKSNHKFEVVDGQELLVRVPLPMAEVWAEMQAQVEELTGQAGLQILRAILENEVTGRVGPPHRPNPRHGYVVCTSRPTLLLSCVVLTVLFACRRLTPARRRSPPDGSRSNARCSS
jgi:hypothetical protein